MKYVLLFLAFLAANSRPAPPALDAAEVFCTATAIYSEARGESFEGKIAVAFGVKNRMQSGEFPNSACAVIYQDKPIEQFSDITKVRPDYEGQAWRDSVEIATLVLAGYVIDPTNGARFWYNPKKAAAPSWARVETLAQIDNHVFYDLAERKGL